MPSNTNPFSGYLGGSDWSSALLEAMPQAAYYSSPTGQTFASRSPRQQRYFQQNFADVQNQWLGAMGEAMRAGDTGPSFVDFMEQQDPWTSRYAQLPQQMRGVNTGLYNPKTRFLYY